MDRATFKRATGQSYSDSRITYAVGNVGNDCSFDAVFRCAVGDPGVLIADNGGISSDATI